MPRPLRIYTIANTLTYNASTYYRLDVPLTTMEELGLPVEPIVDTGDPSVPDANRILAMHSADINLFYQPVSANLNEQMTRLAGLMPARDATGDWRYPPSFVVDTDDNLFMVHPMNPAYKDLGIRMPNGRLLRPGDHVGVITDQGARTEMWHYLGTHAGQCDRCMNIPHNLTRLTAYRDILSNAEGVTCSTPRTARYVTRESGQQTTFVSPNMVRFDHYERVDLRAHDDEVWILWQGSTTHFEDFYEIRNALPLIIKRYPQARFLLWGALHPALVQNLPSDRFRYIPWCRYAEYRLRLCTLGHDIAIAPLRAHAFNQCRSAIKFYESAVIPGRPAAFLGEGGETAYGDEVLDGQTGLLWRTPSEFVEKLSALIEDATLRKTLAANSRDWLGEHRDAMKLAPKLYEFYRTVRERAAANTTLPTGSTWSDHRDSIMAAVSAQLSEEPAANVPT